MKCDCSQTKSEEEARAAWALPGRYHVQVQSADDTFTKNDKSMPVVFELLNGTVPGQEGKTHTEYFSASEKAMKRINLLALACGLVRPGETRDISFATEAPGRQLVIELEEHEYTKKDGTKGKGVRVTFAGMWSVGHKDVTDVPKDCEMLALAAKLQGAGLTTPTAAPATVGATAELPHATAPESAQDPWAAV